MVAISKMEYDTEYYSTLIQNFNLEFVSIFTCLDFRHERTLFEHTVGCYIVR